jgi:glutathione S-transferase
MKLYFLPGACSLSPHIVLRETGANFELEKVNLQEKKTSSGKDYGAVNPKGQVPCLELDSGEKLTEGPVIAQYIADQNASAGLAGDAGTMERYRIQAYKDITRENLRKRFEWIDQQLSGKQYLAVDRFSVADAYLFTVLRWAPRVGIDTAKWSNITAFMDRVAARPKVQEALKAEGLM